MAIGGFSKSRNILAHKRLQKRDSVRRVLLEALEARQLLAVGPQLIGIQPDSGELLRAGDVLNVSPRELVFRFSDNGGIDESSLGAIRVIRSGADGIFDRASIATDFGTNGQTLVEFYAQEAGQAGNGIELKFTAVTRNDSRAPIVRVTGRTINIELNSNPALETRVEDILQAFNPANVTPATNLVYALRLRGSQTIGVGRTVDTTRSLFLSGANSAKASTNFGLGNALEVRFVARETGSAGMGTTLNFTTSDPGGARAPVITVTGKNINVLLNSNPRFTTTARELVDAINASPAFALIEAQLISGSGATRVGSAPTTYSPITLTGVSDVEIIPGYIGLGDSDREVVLRFAEPLPDDSYRIEILGTGVRTLMNVDGEVFNAGVSRSIPFELNLGVQIVSVVPQPVTRDPVTGALSWTRTADIDVYFTEDKLIDVSKVVSVNGLTLGELTVQRQGVLYFQNSDTIVFRDGSTASVLNPQFYQLISSNGTLTTADDAAAVVPSLVQYYPNADRVTLRFQRNLDQYVTAVGGELRLRVGTNESRPMAPVVIDTTATDPGSSFADPLDLSTNWTPAAGTSQSVLIDSKIENTTPFVLDFPGGSDEPGNRQIRMQDNLRLGADTVDGISTFFYNFQGQLGTYLNAITEQQKIRVREVFSLYERYLGVRFVESATQGLTIAVGDLRAVIPFPDIPGGTTPGATEPNQPGLTAYEAGTLASGQLATVLDSQDFSSSLVNDFGGAFTRAAMQAIGKLLGLGDADELEQLTIQSFNSVFAPGVGTEMVFPGDGDIVHGQYLYRPDSKDIDLYQFSLPVAGQISIETFAERMSSASLLDTHLKLYQETPDGWVEIAANDDYFSSDSFIELNLAAGNYIVGVSASGNSTYDPTIADSGLGGLSQGNYQLRMDFTPPAPSVMRDADTVAGTAIDGDGDGIPGGVFDFWFRPSSAALNANGTTQTKFVDKSSTATVANGLISSPYKTIAAAILAASPGDVIRVLGNGGADKNFATQGDNLAYEIGFNSLGGALPDGATLDVPKDVTLMIDAGAILKLRRARIGVGSTSVSVDRSGGALLVLGTPTLQTANGRILTDAAEKALAGTVIMTSLNDSTVGKTTTTAGALGAGDWGGIDFRNRVDTSNNRNRLEGAGVFLNWVSNADIRYGGGQVVIDGSSQVVTPIQMVDSRPAIVHNMVSRSADAAMSATPDSFLESNFHSPTEQGSMAPFTVDYDRVGPDIHGNRLSNNTINGLQVRVTTRPGTQLEKLTTQGRFDDTSIVHYLPENLEVQGTPGGAIQQSVGGATTLVSRLDARLVIDPGTIIKSQGSRIDVAFGSQLIAEGTDGSPIVFTSLKDIRYGAGGTFDTANRAGQNGTEAVSGDWGGIYVGHTSSASLDYAVVAYGGGTTRVGGGFANFNALEVHQADLRLTHSKLELNAEGATLAVASERGGRGTNEPATVFVRGAQPIIVDNIIRANEGVAMSFNVSALNSNFVEDTGRSRGAIGTAVEWSGNQGPLVRDNRMADNGINGLQVRGGNLTTEGVWDDTDIVHVVLDEIIVPDFHAFGGLRLKSSATQSLVVKFESGTDLAGLTATGQKLDNANRIGGSIQLLGQPGVPVILTSLNDNTVGAGFSFTGDVQNETIPVEIGLLPTGPEVDNGTLIDNDVTPGIPGQFSFDVGPAGSANFGGRGGITAQGNTQLLVNEDVIFDFLNLIDVGGNGNAIDLSTSTITLAPTLISPDLVVSEGNFTGPNGLVSWRIESRMDDGIAKVFNTIRLSSATPLGDLQVINYLDEDVRGVTDDLLYVTGTPGQEDFRAFTLDGPERVGFSQGGIYTATNGLLENATYEGWAADSFRNLLTTIETAGTTYTIPGNINTNNLVPFTDPELGDIFGPADITTAFAWRVDPNATTAVVTSFLELVPRNPFNAAVSGDWRGVLLDTNSNDRNVQLLVENESIESPSKNDTPSSPQYLGGLAPTETSGDENRRLGYEIHGAIHSRTDVDVYSFEAQAGTEVWFDIDRTSYSLDTVLELVDANGRVLASSDNSLEEEADPSLLFHVAEIPGESINPLRLSTPELYFESATGAPKDLYSTNPRDAGFRVSLPGAAGTSNLYHLRVRSADATQGSYQLQLRLTEVDEVPGSSINYADIRFAQSGIQLVGVPLNSPLLGENSETSAANDAVTNAQVLGNLLQTNRQAISVAGNLDSSTDVDWYSFTIDYQRIRPTSIREYFATIFDVDYADGLGRPDISFYVFDGNQNLILSSLGSNVVDDQASPIGGADNADLTRGSAGTLDPYIDSYELPSGQYFIAVTNSSRMPQVMTQFTDPASGSPLVRLQPIEGLQLIAEEHVSFNGGSTAAGPVVPDLFTADAEVAWNLGDIVLYVSRDAGVQTNLYMVNPFTGEVSVRFDNPQGLDVEDIAFRPNGELRAFDRAVLPPLNGDLDGQIDYVNIDTGTGAFTTIGTTGLETFHREVSNATPPVPSAVDSNDGVNPEAITFADIAGAERGFFVGSRPTPNGVTPDYFGPPVPLPNVGTTRPGPDYYSNVLYEFDEVTGAALGTVKTDLLLYSGAGTNVTERAYIETRNTTGAQPTLLFAREVTTTQAGQLVNVIDDGDTFTLFNPAGPPNNWVFEFDLGPEARVNYNPAAGFGIRDGMTFTIDGVNYEFDTGSVVVIDALNGGQLTDGTTVTIRNAGGVERVFEFDNNNSLSVGTNVGVSFTAGSTQANLVNALVAAVNLTGFGVRAESVAGSNRISLVGASTTVPVTVAGTGVSVDGTVGATGTRIPLSEAATESQFVAALAAAMPNNVQVSFESGRLNFSGATSADFGDLETDGIFVDQNSAGASPFNTVIRVLANDTAETVARRIVAAVNGLGFAGLSATSSGDRVQLFGATVANPGSLQTGGVAPGGIVTGIAVIGNTLFAVSDEGGLYRVNNPQLAQGTVNGYVATASDLLGINFTGLVAGPANTSITGTNERILFGIDTAGVIYAFNTRGELQPVFANGATSVRTNLGGANGLALSTLQTNLWTTTNTGDNTNRENDAGHGLPATPNNSRGTTNGGSSYYFGNATNVNYNFPGGAAGALESATFSLAGLSAADQPMLYFNYLSATENVNGFDPRDAFRVYASGEDGNWVLLATNNTDPDTELNVHSDIQPLFDQSAGVTTGWRQARVPLDRLAGQENVKLRIEFSTGAGFGFGRQGGQGPEIRTMAGNRLFDGQDLTIQGQRFEIEMGPSLTLPGGLALANGDSVTVDGVRYVFTDGTGPAVTAPDVPVLFESTFTAQQVAEALGTAIEGATIVIPELSGFTFAESNDVISKANQTGATGQSMRLVGLGEIGDRLSDPDQDVDMVRIDVQQGADVTINVSTTSIGSTLDSFLRVFDIEGNQVASTASMGGGNSLLTLTDLDAGAYFVGVSGAGNQTYDPVIPGLAASGSTGTYELSIEIRSNITPVVSGNRLQLEGASLVSVGADSPIQIQGATGTSGVPVRVDVGMTTAQVTAALQAAIADYFAGGRTSAYPSRGGDTINLTGLTVDDGGPFGVTTAFPGQQFTTFNSPVRAQNNNFEGVYVDDFIIGVAGRGEMVLGQPGGNTNFVADPNATTEILTGPYQFELRGGTEYGRPLVGSIVLEDTFTLAERSGAGLSIRFNDASQLVAGATFTVGDGPRVVTFELDDVNDGVAVAANHVALPFNSAVLDPSTGGLVAESAEIIAARFRDLLNSPLVQSQINVAANLLNNDRFGATSDTVILIGNATAMVPATVGERIVSTRNGGGNRVRPQGQIVINAARVSDSAGFGITVDAAPRDPVTGAPLTGVPRNTITLNADALTAGAVIMNSQFIGNTAGGINISGDEQLQQNGVLWNSTRSFVRLVNNTIVGGSVFGDDEGFTAGGVGIQVADNATATLLNNVIVNSTVGINVDASSSSTVIGGSVYYRNTSNVGGSATLGQFATVVPPTTKVFESIAERNLYPAASSPVIDSSIDSLEDRPSLVAVKGPLGISPSPILAPVRDINGQLRVDDPNVETPAGLGERVFKDRGSQDRADFTGPSVRLITPIDNDAMGVDGNAAETVVELSGQTLRYFDISILDGLEPSDPSRGVGVDDSTVNSSSVLLYGPKTGSDGIRRQNQPLVEGQDYRFGYDTTNGIIRLTPLAGIWESEAVYTVRFLNVDAGAFVLPTSGQDGNQFSVVDSRDITTTFELDYGYIIQIPSLVSVDPDTLDGKTFVVDDGAKRITFELDRNNIVATGNVAINVSSVTTAEQLGRLVETAIKQAAFNLTITEISSGRLQLQGARGVMFDPVDSGMMVTGEPGVQTAFGLQIPLRAGAPFGLSDGQTFTITRGTGTPVDFELDTNGVTQPDNVPVRYLPGASAANIGAILATAINGASLGLTASYAGGGLVILGGDATTQLGLTNTVLSQAGEAGEGASIAIPISALGTTDFAAVLKSAIDARNLPGVVVTQFGNRLVVEGANSVSGTGAAQISAIQDLAGNSLKANQVDGTTTLTIFFGEGLDYGDAQSSSSGGVYTTSSADGGPSHRVIDGLSLGPTVSVDADARLNDADLDDGVTFTTGFFAGFTANAEISVTNTTGRTAYVSLWIDFNGDGVFAPTERFMNAQAVTNPVTAFSVLVPSTAMLGETFMRVRLSTDPASIASAITPIGSGPAPDGEVEDHRITIGGNPFTNPRAATDPEAIYDVNNDGFVSPIDILQVINWYNDPSKPRVLSLPAATGLPPFIDVNADGLVSPLDILRIINFLNARVAGSGGEGEDTQFATGSMEELGSMETTVLASDWAAGLETALVSSRRSSADTRSQQHPNDLAILSNEGAGELSFVASAQSTAAPIDQFWADLADDVNDDEESDASDSLIDPLLGFWN